MEQTAMWEVELTLRNALGGPPWSREIVIAPDGEAAISKVKSAASTEGEMVATKLTLLGVTTVGT